MEQASRHSNLSRNSLQRAIQLGEQVQRSFERGHSQQNRSALSLRGLAHQMGLAIPTTTSWRAWSIYRWSCEEPEIADCRHLRVGHFSVLLGAGRAHRLSLLRAAEHERWSRRELQRRARALQGAPE